MTPRQLAAKATRPAPVYEAHFTDGTYSRMSFWTQTGKPFDLDRARGLFAPGVEIKENGRVLPACFKGKALAMGYVEHDVFGEEFVRFADPFFSGEAIPAKPKARATIKQARTVIRELLAVIDPETINSKTLTQARELIAA